MTIVYGDTGGGGPGATAGSTTGAGSDQAQEKSTLGGVLANLAASPSITVYAADGSGTDVASISPSSRGPDRPRRHAHVHARNGRDAASGSVTVVVPSGWTPPSTVAGPGFSTASVGSLTVAGQTITVTGVTRTATQTLVITYGSGNTATAPSTPGAQTWNGAGGLDRGGCPHLDRVVAGDHCRVGRRLRDDDGVSVARLGLAEPG